MYEKKYGNRRISKKYVTMQFIITYFGLINHATFS